jgi:hypothetical protein
MPKLIEGIEKVEFFIWNWGGGLIEGEDNLNKFTTEFFFWIS